MSAPTEIKAGAASKRPRRTTKATQDPVDKPSATVRRAAEIFALIDDETQEALLVMLTEMVKRCPRQKRPALRLVSGGAK